MLTMGYWPTQSAPPCTLPAPIQACCTGFEAFYLEKHQGKCVSRGLLCLSLPLWLFDWDAVGPCSRRVNAQTIPRQPQHTGRKVVWQTGMGSADLKANFGGRRHDLIVPTYSMCILMLFNDHDALTLDEVRGAGFGVFACRHPIMHAKQTTDPSHPTYKQIHKATQMPEAELRRNLISLSTKRHQILIKASKQRGVADDDTFTFNFDFTVRLW